MGELSQGDEPLLPAHRTCQAPGTLQEPRAGHVHDVPA